MQLDGSSWLLTNLSTTNPVVHNERMLGEGEVQPLSDGDRIEMGEVVFRYRAR
jgi:predicted component of type VI protein secretion system